MNLPISDRLLACCSLVSPGDRVADIGCDHGYLGIHLLTNGIATSVIASDVKEQPLNSAVRNANKYGVSDRISFYLSDGARNIPRDFDTLVCAGMGADTMISILEGAPWLRSDRYRLILQCQSKTHMLRKYLSETGWRVPKESVLRDGHFLYTVMEVIWSPGYILTPGQWYFPSALLENPSEAVPEYYRRTVRKLTLAVNGRGVLADTDLVTALQELTDLVNRPELQYLKEDSHDNNC